jgi:hypothetical protein
MAQQSPRVVGTIIWGALVAGVLMFLAISLVVRMPGNAELAGVLVPVSGGMSLVSAALSWLWAIRMKPPAPPGGVPPGPDATALTRLIVASAICEGSALFAIVVFLVTRDALALLSFAVSFVALVAHFPGGRHWARLAGAAAPGSWPNRMIRG